VSMSAAARFRYTLVAGATAVVIGTGFTVIGLSRHAEAETATTVTGAEEPLVPATTPAAETPSDLPTLSPSPVRSASPTPTRTSAAPKVKKTTSTPKPSKSTRRSVAAVPRTGDNVLDDVLAHINAARTDAGLSPLTLDTNLSKASALHNQLRINGCGLQHQCSGEAGLGDRFSAQGVKWSSAGENIGFGSSGASDAQMIRAANGLTDSMLAETPPNDGHRKNLLNTGFKRIGLSVVRDAKGITWMTQDFVN
jgi:uncharacterized protein YkwD